MKRIFVFILLLFSQYQVIYSISNIYGDAMTRYVDEVVEEHEFALRESGYDSIYNHTLLFETDASNVLRELPQTIHGYRVINFGIPELQCYLDTVPDGIIRFFFLDKMDFCKECQAQFYIRFVRVVVRKINLRIDIRDMEVDNFSYTYNCETNTFEYKYYVTGDFDLYDAIEFLKRKGLKGYYYNIKF